MAKTRTLDFAHCAKQTQEWHRRYKISILLSWPGHSRHESCWILLGAHEVWVNKEQANYHRRGQRSHAAILERFDGRIPSQSLRQCHAGCKGWSKRKAEQPSTDAWLWYESSAIIFHALQANRLLLYDSASFLFFGIVVIRSYLILHHQSPTETKIPYQYLDISSQQILNKYFLTIKRVSIS